MTDAPGWVAALFAVDPAGLGGVALRSSAGPARDAWLAALRSCLPDGTPWRRLPPNTADERMLGGLDLAATLRAGKPIAGRGVLAEASGGVVLLPMAERLPAATAARLAAVMDQGQVVLERDGLARRFAVSIGVVALDEGMAADERPPVALLDRLAFALELGPRAGTELPVSPAAVLQARTGLDKVMAPPAILDALGQTAAALGITSVRAMLMALRVAHAAAALGGRDTVTEEDAILAGRLVFGPRATALPEQPEPAPEQADDHPPDTTPPDGSEDGDGADKALGEVMLDAAKAAIPAGLLAQLLAGGPLRRAGPVGRAGALTASPRRGRPAGVRAGALADGVRLNLVETLRAAAPWQRLRRTAEAGPRVLVRREDFRITRFQLRTESTAIFVVDASGSSALNRLAEAKGAVELLLAECYVRRDQVALLAFRGAEATLLLPPTRSLVRAKRGLAGLVGGGGTPLATALDQAGALADAVRRRGQTPFVVLLTDGRANIARDGSPGRVRAGEDARMAARLFRAANLAAVLIDTSPNPQPQAASVAADMGARYLPLPYADAAALSRAVRAAEPARG